MQVAKAEKQTMKKRITWQGCCILFSAAIAVAPVIQAAGEESIRLAKAIGEDTTPPPAAPKDKTAPPGQPGTGTASTQEVAGESQPLSPAAKVGLAIAGLLALAGGGGGGGGGGAPTTSQ